MLTRSRFVNTPEKQNTKCKVVKEYNTSSVPSTDVPSPPLLKGDVLSLQQLPSGQRVGISLDKGGALLCDTGWVR